jgi:hypothetical protein
MLPGLTILYSLYYMADCLAYSWELLPGQHIHDAFPPNPGFHDDPTGVVGNHLSDYGGIRAVGTCGNR